MIFVNNFLFQILMRTCVEVKNCRPTGCHLVSKRSSMSFPKKVLLALP